jgi:hypothetical protein
MLSSTFALAGERTYTNEDLKSYEKQYQGEDKPSIENKKGENEKGKASVGVMPTKSISHGEPMRRSDKLEPIVQTSDFNRSFNELHKYIGHRLKKTRVPKYQIYLRPLSKGMTQARVKQLWGTKTSGGMHAKGDDKKGTVDIYNYEIGISLYFKDNKLQGWKTYNNPQYDRRIK